MLVWLEVNIGGIAGYGIRQNPLQKAHGWRIVNG